MHQTDIQNPHPDHQAAQDAHDIGIEAQQRHHHGQGQHARQHQELHGRQAEGLEGIDFLIDLHGAQLGGKSPAGAARHDDTGHDGGHQAHHGNPHQIGHVDLGSEQEELNGPHEGQDKAHQETDQRNDG